MSKHVHNTITVCRCVYAICVHYVCGGMQAVTSVNVFYQGHTHTHTHARTYARSTHACTHAHTHTHACTHIHTHSQTYRLIRFIVCGTVKFDGLYFYVQILACSLFKPESLQQQTQANRLLSLDVLSFISQHQVRSSHTILCLFPLPLLHCIITVVV